MKTYTVRPCRYYEGRPSEQGRRVYHNQLSLWVRMVKVLMELLGFSVIHHSEYRRIPSSISRPRVKYREWARALAK